MINFIRALEEKGIYHPQIPLPDSPMRPIFSPLPIGPIKDSALKRNNQQEVE